MLLPENPPGTESELDEIVALFPSAPWERHDQDLAHLKVLLQKTASHLLRNLRLEHASPLARDALDRLSKVSGLAEALAAELDCLDEFSRSRMLRAPWIDPERSRERGNNAINIGRHLLEDGRPLVAISHLSRLIKNDFEREIGSSLAGRGNLREKVAPAIPEMVVQVGFILRNRNRGLGAGATAEGTWHQIACGVYTYATGEDAPTDKILTFMKASSRSLQEMYAFVADAKTDVPCDGIQSEKIDSKPRLEASSRDYIQEIFRQLSDMPDRARDIINESRPRKGKNRPQ